MKYIEIDGERIEVEYCNECPCCDEGDNGYGAQCKHPSVSRVDTTRGFNFRHGAYFDDDSVEWDCPLREVGE